MNLTAKIGIAAGQEVEKAINGVRGCYLLRKIGKFDPIEVKFAYRELAITHATRTPHLYELKSGCSSRLFCAE